MNDLISVIVPVYNVEAYLRRCIDSIINQTYQNIELILIDDGSVDDSGKICDEYSKKDSRIKVIHKENKGVSHTRNTGISLARGKYITFCDSDDYIESKTYEKIMNRISKTDFDVVIINYNIVRNNKTTPKIFDIPSEMTRDQYLYYMSKKYFRGFCWNKMYKNTIIKQNNINFNEDITICEDTLFNVNIAKHIKKIGFINENLYNYCIRKNSAVTSEYKTKNLTELKAYEEIINILYKISRQNVIYYKEAYLETAFKIRDLYEKCKEERKNDDKEYIYQSINKYYKDIILSKDIEVKRKVFFIFNKKLPIIMRFFRNIKHKVGG